MMRVMKYGGSGVHKGNNLSPDEVSAIIEKQDIKMRLLANDAKLQMLSYLIGMVEIEAGCKKKKKSVCLEK